MKGFVCGMLLALSLTAAPARAQISGDAVKIGVMNDRSGPLSAISGAGSLAAARLAVEDFGPTVLGKPIEILTADHQNQTDVGAAIARRWYDVEGVDAIMDITNSAISLAVQEISREKSKIVIHVGSGTDRLYGADCAETGFVWAYDSYAVAQALVKSLTVTPATTWFIIGTDYAASKSTEAVLMPLIQKEGGKVVGVVHHPLGETDYASYLLQAQAADASIIALLNTGSDTTNTIKQAAEFGLVGSGQALVSTTAYLQTVHALGLQTAQGFEFITTYYWDRTDATRAFARRFKQMTGTMPSQVHAGVYSATLAYLRAIAKAGTDDGRTVAAMMKKLPVDDQYAEGARVRADGRLMKDAFLVRVKSPAASKGEWDYYDILRRMPAADIIRPVGEGGCKITW